MEALAPIALALPLLVSAFLACTSKILPRMLADLLALGTAAAVTVMALLLMRESATVGTIVYWLGNWRPENGVALGIALVIDPMAAGMAALTAFLSITALVFAWRYFEAIGTLFHTLMLIFLAAMVGFCLSGDIFTLFVFFELMSIAAFALTAHKIEASSIEGALNFAITNSIAAFSLLWGIALLYGRTGALNLAQIGRALGSGPPDHLVVVAFGLIICGFFIKAAVVPFHFWLADAHAVAPTPVCVLFSGVMVELGIYGVLRVYWTVFHPVMQAEEIRLRILLLALGAATSLLGAFMAFWQRHFKRLLAFSTISHVGMLLAGIGTLNARGVGGAGLYVIGHGMVKSALFLCAGLFLQRFGSIDELKLRGQGRETKFVGLIVLVAALGLAGFPPFGTYLGKNLMEESAQRFGQEWLSWVFALASVITGAAALRVGGRVFLGWGGEPKGEAASPTESETRETKGGGPLPPVMVTTAAVLALLPAFSSFVPGFSHAMQAAAERLVDTRAYAAAVLDSKWSGAIHASEATEVTMRGFIIGFATAGAALALAAFSLSQKRLPAIAPLKAIRMGLRHLHSGDARDYVAWLSLGLATIGGALLVLLR